MDARENSGMPEAGKTQKVAYTATAGSSTAFTTDRVVRVVTSSDAHIRFGGTAVVDVDLYMPAYTPEYFNVPKGYVVSAVQVSAGGNMFVTPM